MKKYIIALDQGTTSSRAVLFNENGIIEGLEQEEFKQIFPKPGWVEHSPEDILNSQTNTLKQLISNNNINPRQITGIGITNQRETTIIWDKHTGKPVYNALVWQDKRTTDLCQDLKDAGHESIFREKTGLFLDSYFSGSKINWILNQNPTLKERAKKGDLLFGTVDSWLIWNLTNGQVHATDYSNASRTLLYNINTLEWDDELLALLDIPSEIMPKVLNSADNYGYYNYDGVNIPILSAIGDQQAALFGHGCFESGSAKNTYGTGCFMLMNTGSKKIQSHNGLISTIAWGIDNQVQFALEGSVFIAGAAIQWLRDGLKIISTSAETEELANNANPDSEVVVVPAFAGLGAPYWDMYARGAIYGLTRDTGIAEISKATLESLALQSKDVLISMERDSNIELHSLFVDGGASANDYLMQFQSNLLQSEINRPKNIESTATGAAFLAGIKAGIWNLEDLKKIKSNSDVFSPNIPPSESERKYHLWKKAVKRTMNWENQE